MMDVEKRYCDFSIEDLVTEEAFCELVKKQDDAFSTLLDKYPEQRDKFIFASRIIKGFDIPVKSQSSESKLRIWKQITSKKRTKLRIRFVKYAAAVGFIISLSVGFLYWQTSTSEILEFAKSHPVQGSESQLILFNGKNFRLSGSSKVEHLNNGGKIAVNDTVVESSISEQKGYNQLIIPYGKRSCIVLSDGTRVDMNSGSRLVYPERFNGDKREVFLEGEAFFDVTKDIKHPFVVQTDKFRLQVLGTKFNVQTYPSEKVFNAVLVEGSVKLASGDYLFAKHVVLHPNQMASVDTDKKLILVSEVENMQNHISWLKGHLDFKNEKLGNLLGRISRYYNIKIDYEESLAQSIYISGKLDLKEDPDRILDGLSVIAKVGYKKEGGKYIFIISVR